jgi:hypothetical protein
LGFGTNGKDRIETRNSITTSERPRKELSKVGSLIKAMNGAKDKLNGPLGRDALRLKRVCQAQATDHKVGLGLQASIELTVNVLALT